VKSIEAAIKLEGADSPAFLALFEAAMSRCTMREQESLKAKLAEAAGKARTAKQKEAEAVAAADIPTTDDAAKKGR
jgi:hypothetical protein